MFPFYERIILSNIHLLKGEIILLTGSNGLIGSNILAFLDYVIHAATYEQPKISLEGGIKRTYDSYLHSIRK